MADPTKEQKEAVHQNAVDAMAKGLFEAEGTTETAMIFTGKLMAIIRQFRKDCELHPMATADAASAIGVAMASLGEAAAALKISHELLDELRKECELPDVTPRGGGGGGKGG